ncbi:MAG: GntG family PLP-dependent aldolase [Myxococcota bacterium]|nr:GntG family PLP-dependent aldolase [Myxococcota bacterium]
MTIDLRSDTVTRPDDAMRRAMASAEVGDDIYGEDPSARRLEEEVAERLGKEAALFVPSGTMGNQVALLVHCRPGDDVVVGEDAHCMLYESGAAAAIAGVQFSIAGQGGLFDVAELEAALRPASAYYMPRTRLVALEDTHNRGGGIVWPAGQAARVADRAKALGLGTHLDGARLWNAAAARGVAPAEIAAPFDTVSVCFSKGLGAPVGSAIAGSRAAIDEARRARKMLGGAMRQVGVLCAAALHALEHNLARLPEDHATARRLAEGVAALDGVSIALDAVQTNIVCFEVADAHDFVERARARGVWLNAMTPTTVRAVTHLHIGEADIDRALEALAGN